jgi:hypothetical protein
MAELLAVGPTQRDAAWTEELRESAQRIAGLMQGPLLPENAAVASTQAQMAPPYPGDLPPMVSKPF